MSERLTVSLEDGSIERLRTLAGGERKVGQFLSGIVRFLVTYEELVSTENFQDLCIMRRVSTDELPQQALREIEENYQAWRSELEAEAAAQAQAQNARLESLEAVMRNAGLLTQQDSSQNA